MKFCHVTISVKDLEESLKFYQEVIGLSVTKRFQGGPGTEIAFLSDGEGGTEVELIHDQNAANIDLGKHISLGFEVESAENALAFVKEKGYAAEGGIFNPTPHVKFFFIKDPNGLRIQFVENIR